jgi:hypothetical protein
VLRALVQERSDEGRERPALQPLVVLVKVDFRAQAHRKTGPWPDPERLSPETRERLLGWEHSGFSVYGRQVLSPDDPAQVAQRLRYVTRAPWRTDAARLAAEGKVWVRTPGDPASGPTETVLDPLERVHAVVAQIPDPGLHLTRSYGAYSNRLRRRWAPLRAGRREAGDEACAGGDGAENGANLHADPPASEFVRHRKASWARL